MECVTVNWRLLLLCLVLTASAAPASAAWQEARSRHFVIYSEQKPDELKAYAERLERFDQAVRVARGMKDPALSESGKLSVFVLKNTDAIEAILGARGSGVAGFYIPRASGAVAFVHREKTSDKFDLSAETVFFHEYLHHLMLQQSDLALPSWLVEGFAEFFATARIEDDGSVTLGYVPEYRSRGLFNLRGLTMEEMLGATDRNIDAQEWELTYGRGWLLAHYLTFEKSRRNQLGRYIAGIQRGESAIGSARAAFGDLKQLNRELDTYLRAKRHSGIGIPASKLVVGPVALRSLTAAENAILPVRMKLAIGYKKRFMTRLLTDARGVASAFPNDGPALAALARAEFDSKHFELALAAADRSLAASPTLRGAMIVNGRSLMELGKSTPKKANWKEIRSWFTKANRLDPDDAEPLMLFYESFGAEGVPATRNAVQGLTYAHGLVPQDSDLRMLLVRQLITDANFDGAQKVYGPIAYDPHAGKSRQDRMLVVARLKAKDTKGAIALLDQLATKEEKDE